MKKKILKLLYIYFSKGALPYWFILFIDSFIVVAAGLFAQLLYARYFDIFANTSGVIVSMCCYLLAYLIGFRIMHT